MTIKERINQELNQFTEDQLREVANFIAFIKFRSRLTNLPQSNPSQIANLYSQFAEEDRLLAEEGISEYAELLQQEDLA